MTEAPLQATEDFKWPVGVSRSIAVPAGEVWAAISRPGNLELCHPFCAKNPVHVWPGPAARDEVHYLSGWIYERRFTNWLDGVGYDLEIGGRGEATSFVTWRVEPTDRLTCALSITVYPHVMQRLPDAVRWLPHTGYIRPMLNRYLTSVVRGFEWYVTRGRPVAPNQFGRHPWFSEKRRGR